ncbi:MAG: hypothetical protein PHR68_00310 [Candidatus Gracilibacteria bacterium]|nr:hypothetical protein [Candidatus Gracilibacteria bacterium]
MINFVSINTELLKMYDIWSIQHFFFGVFIGAFVSFYNKKHINKLLKAIDHPEIIIENITRKNIFYFDLVTILLIAYMWETFEHYIDVGYWGPYIQSFVQHETFSNRFIGDPSVLVLGYFLSVRFKYLKYAALIFTGIFLFVHIFIFRINP